MRSPDASLKKNSTREEMYGVMDLCLGCKACKSECPSSVDMAKIKAEYLVHYYERNGLPLFNRMMGLLPTLNELLYNLTPFLTPVVNWGLKTPLAKSILRQDRRPPCPRFARLCAGDLCHVVLTP